jgi:hypothetical protein
MKNVLPYIESEIVKAEVLYSKYCKPVKTTAKKTVAINASAA